MVKLCLVILYIEEREGGLNEGYFMQHDTSLPNGGVEAGSASGV